MSTVIAIDSYDSDIAGISSYLEGSVYPYLQGKGFTLSPFYGPVAVPAYVGPAAAGAGVSLLTGAGHGSYSSFAGAGEDVFAVGSYAPEQVRGKIAHFISCESAKQLGPDFVKNGCLAFIGYDENFTFNSAFGDSFFGCDAEILLALADGLTVADAVARAKNLYAQTIADLMARGDAGALDAAHRLQYNLQHLRSPLDGPQWGNGNAKLS